MFLRIVNVCPHHCNVIVVSAAMVCYGKIGMDEKRVVVAKTVGKSSIGD